MLKYWGLQVKGLQSYRPSKFENNLTSGEFKSGPTGLSGADFFLRPPILTASNFEALLPTDLLKKCNKNQEAKQQYFKGQFCPLKVTSFTQGLFSKWSIFIFRNRRYYGVACLRKRLCNRLTSLILYQPFLKKWSKNMKNSFHNHSKKVSFWPEASFEIFADFSHKIRISILAMWDTKVNLGFLCQKITSGIFSLEKKLITGSK